MGFKIAGYDVDFPVRPYPSQLAFMSKVCDAKKIERRLPHVYIFCVLQSISLRQNALLESPTGTGKSLALLCSALAWTTSEKERLRDEWNRNCSDDAGSKKRRKKPPGSPKIYYATRTHSQIAQIVQELASTAYRPTMSILASRRRYCVNKKVLKSSDIKSECERLLEVGSCSNFHNAGKLKKFVPDVWDIEDLITLGKKRKCCPYFGSRLIAGEENCELIFCRKLPIPAIGPNSTSGPYSYIVDPLVRSAVGIDCKDSIIIFDEAHNIEEISREAASGEFSFDSLTEAATALQAAKDFGFETELLKPLARMTDRIVQWMKENEILLKNVGYEHEQTIFTGPGAATDIEGIELTAEVAGEMASHASKIADASAKIENKGKGLEAGITSLLKALYTILNYLLEQPSDFMVVLAKSLTVDKKQWRFRRKPSKRVWEYKLKIWCMNPAVSFCQVSRAARCTILTSGTLAPCDSFESELDTLFPQRLEARHVISQRNLFAGIISKGVNSQQLTGTYQFTSTYAYQDAIGNLVSTICSSVPDGVLVFFSSYKLLENCCERWKDTGKWQDLETRKKCVCTETRDVTNFEKVFQKFRSGMSDEPGQSETKSGSLLLAVCRGKVSEGVDFTDRDARAVVIVGIPYPNCQDEKVKMKRNYNDQRLSEKSSLNSNRKFLKGSRWYELQAFRALNQALGRCIRHKNDYGAILLVDSRFTREGICKNLSKWFRSRLASTRKKHLIARDIKSRLKTFFQGHALQKPSSKKQQRMAGRCSDDRRKGVNTAKSSCRALFLLHEKSRKTKSGFTSTIKEGRCTPQPSGTSAQKLDHFQLEDSVKDSFTHSFDSPIIDEIENSEVPTSDARFALSKRAVVHADKSIFVKKNSEFQDEDVSNVKKEGHSFALESFGGIYTEIAKENQASDILDKTGDIKMLLSGGPTESRFYKEHRRINEVLQVDSLSPVCCERDPNIGIFKRKRSSPLKTCSEKNSEEKAKPNPPKLSKTSTNENLLIKKKRISKDKVTFERKKQKPTFPLSSDDSDVSDDSSIPSGNLRRNISQHADLSSEDEFDMKFNFKPPRR